MPETAPPEPSTPADATAFMAELRRLKTWSGRSYRQLERRAAAAGDTLPYSTAASMLGRDRLPREELLVAFVRACGIDDVLPWAAARAALAHPSRPRTGPADLGPAPAHPADLGPMPAHPADLGPVPARLRRHANHESLIDAASGHKSLIDAASGHKSLIDAAGGHESLVDAAGAGVPGAAGARRARPPRQLVAAIVLLVAVAVALTVGVTYTVGGHTANVEHTVRDR